ncbi:MAG: N-methyl-L-tryptophan oxidase, partial [Chloroflexota bacterium]
MHYDVVVIGIGGMGSATLYQLAKRGLNVLGIEQFDVPHEMGSSHGLTRIIRLAYYEDPSYVPLLRRAYALWDELERESGAQVFHQTGSIDMGTEDSEVFAGSLHSCLKHDLPYEVLDSAELRERFPAYRMPADIKAVFQPQGGLLVPELCISTHVELAQKHGATLHTNERVLGWDIQGDQTVSIRTDKATYTIEKLVNCG